MLKNSVYAMGVMLCVVGVMNGHQGGKHSMNESQEVKYQVKEIHTQELRAWLEEGKAVTILDARTKEYDNGQRIPSAKFIPYNSEEDVIIRAIPSKDSLVVVYCASEHCPASGWLAERLQKLGYTQVYEYPEGIADWVHAGYPVDSAK